MQFLDIVVMEGDETGQELLVEALRVLEPEVIGLPIRLQVFDLSLAHRRATNNGVVHDAAGAMRKVGLGIKAATVTPEGALDVGSPNRLLREDVGGKVIIRTGRRIPGITPLGGVHHPISIVRMAVGDAYGAEEGRRGVPGSQDEEAYRTERISRSVCRAVAETAFLTATSMKGQVYGGPKWTVSPVYEGMLKEEMDEAALRHPSIVYQPVLIDATYAGLVGGARDLPLVVPALNRDGDCLSDLVLPLFGSIAGAESVLLAFEEGLLPSVVMTEAPHGTAPSLEGKDVANPMAMILACAAALEYAGRRGVPRATAASVAIRDAVFSAVRDGVATFDLGGHSTTSQFTSEVVVRIQERLMERGAPEARGSAFGQ